MPEYSAMTPDDSNCKDCAVSGDDAIVEVVRAMAEVQRRMALAATELRRNLQDVVHTSSSVRASNQRREDAPDFLRNDPQGHFGPGIEVFLTVRFEDNSQAEWFGWAINRLNGSGWTVEREVSLDVPDGRPEVNRVASTELDEVTISDSLTFVHMLPSLIDELTALPVPKRPAS